MQLKRIVTEFPRVEPIAYAFTYDDTASYEEEVDEWFSYNELEFARLQAAKSTFGKRWSKFETSGWFLVDHSTRRSFVEAEVAGLQVTDLQRRCKSLQTLLHIVLGVWEESAGIKDDAEISSTSGLESVARTAATKSQVEAMKDGVLLITECGGVGPIFEALRNSFELLW
jgi:hypothetical protein